MEQQRYLRDQHVHCYLLGKETVSLNINRSVAQGGMFFQMQKGNILISLNEFGYDKNNEKIISVDPFPEAYYQYSFEICEEQSEQLPEEGEEILVSMNGAVFMNIFYLTNTESIFQQETNQRAQTNIYPIDMNKFASVRRLKASRYLINGSIVFDKEAFLNTKEVEVSTTEAEPKNEVEVEVNPIRETDKSVLIDFINWYRQDDLSGYEPEHLAEWYIKNKEQEQQLNK